MVHRFRRPGSRALSPSQPHEPHGLYERWVTRPVLQILSGTTQLKTLMRISIAVLVLVFLTSQSETMSTILENASSGLAVLALPLSARLVGASLAVLSVALVTFVYTLLIQRGSLMATTTLYPRRPIEDNIGSLLDASWPQSTTFSDVGATSGKPISGEYVPSSAAAHAIQLFYVGKMTGGEPGAAADRIAKGRVECAATPEGQSHRRSLWLTSGSALAKNIVQVLVWEWVSLWLLIMMILGTLLFNGFLTDNLNPDSFPRLTVLLIYLAAYLVHFCYVWLTCIRFFRSVFGGAAWSLLERAKFVVAETAKIRGHRYGTAFTFRSIDKASDTFVPTTIPAILGENLTGSPMLLSPASTAIDDITSPTKAATMQTISMQSQPSTPDTKGSAEKEEKEDPVELRAALATIDSAQKAERATATASSALALDRVIANAMIMMSVTLSSGFASWTSTQLSDNSPNNTTTTQIGSLALLASLSLGAATMFTSAMHLEITGSAFRTILSLKETKINGLALDHYRKRRSGGGGGGVPTGSAARGTPAAFTQDTVPLAQVGLADFFRSSRSSRGWWAGLLGVVALGPAYAMLPRVGDHDRRSAEVDFDFVARVSTGTVVLTTRPTDRHARNKDGSNVEAVNVCHIPEERYGKEGC